MAEFDRASAATLLVQQNANTVQLWTLYVGATFAAAGFSFAGSPPPYVAVLVTIGFWFFTIGHFTLILQALRFASALRDDIDRSFAGAPATPDPFETSFRALMRTAVPPHLSIVSHLVIDTVVTLALLHSLIWK